MAEKNKLSIYLIKDDYSGDDAQILKSVGNLQIEIDKTKKVYFAPSRNFVPAWVESFFRGTLDGASLFISNASLI